MNTSSSSAGDSASPEAPLPAPVHDFIVRVADRGPSTRALAVVSVVGVALFAISLLALPRKAPPLESPVAARAPSAPAAPAVSLPVATVEQPALPQRSLAPATTGRTFSSEPRAPSVTAASVQAPVAAREPAATEAPARVVNAPGVSDAPRAEIMPVGATSRAPIDLVVAPAPPSREAEIAPSIPRDALTPRPPREQDRSAAE